MLQKWTAWNNTDGSQFEADIRDKRVPCYRNQGQRYVATIDHGCGSVMVWCGTVGGHKTLNSSWAATYCWGLHKRPSGASFSTMRFRLMLNKTLVAWDLFEVETPNFAQTLSDGSPWKISLLCWTRTENAVVRERFRYFCASYTFATLKIEGI